MQMQGGALSLNSAGGVALCKVFHLCYGYQIEIMLNAMLQAGGCHGKTDGILIAFTGEQAVDQTAAKAVTATHAVDNVQMIGLREAVILAVVKHTCPVVITCRDRG